MNAETMTYAGSGVDYDAMDPFKRAAQRAALQTSHTLLNLHENCSEVEMSRGESAYLIETADGYLAHVEEGLGTKNLVADEMYRLTGKTYYDHIAQDTVAMIVNDMITLGAMPLSVAMHLAVGDSTWFDDEKRSSDLIEGWKHACIMSRCAWGGGETPTLKDIVLPGTAVLSGSAIGRIDRKRNLLSPEKIREGDAIAFVESSGIHANGLTLARRIAEKLPDGYLTPIEKEWWCYGHHLLKPTHIYVELMRILLARRVDVHYAVNITGHGWRKLMRAPQPLAYVIEKLPHEQPIFRFLREHGPLTDREAYGNLNMGAGFALYLPEEAVGEVVTVAMKLNLDVTHAGHIEKSDAKKVVIEPKGLVYEADSLAVR